MVELDDFEEDLKVLNERLKNLNSQKEERIKLGKLRSYSVEKIMANRDIEKLFDKDTKSKEFTFKEWDLKTKEEKKHFIARYIESITIENDKNKKYGIDITDIKLKSIYKNKIEQLTKIGASDFKLPFVINGEVIDTRVSCPLTSKQLNIYLKELKQIDTIHYYEIDNFEESIFSYIEKNNVDLSFNANSDNEEIYKFIPIIKDNQIKSNKDEIYNLGILTNDKILNFE